VAVSFDIDIFKMEKEGPLWRGSANTLEDANERIQQLGKIEPGEYLIANHRTGERLQIRAGKAEAEHGEGIYAAMCFQPRAPSAAVSRERGHFTDNRGSSESGHWAATRQKVARPERFELPTLWFEARCSDPLSYGRVEVIISPGG
jgi:hypothetical protein